MRKLRRAALGSVQGGAVPDLVTHYVSSYLVARSALRPRYAALLALAGLLPDIDVLLRVHRWVTHSIPMALLAAAPILLFVRVKRREFFRFAALALLIYVLHIALDLFTAPTPALWPLYSSVWVRVELAGALTVSGLAVHPEVEVVTMPADFTPREAIEGSVVTETGLVLAVVAATLTALDTLKNKAGRG